ncbi:lycopene cyclase family protein [Bernardetia sp. ABR2-2B]|uniref:lycopene cyclase family protein n=1 Tax=Bernardetia sp. ABR2-2B TaxID=3127472 RepID=UPI0030D39280
MTKFDIIIVGAGAAGLSLAYHLSKSIWADKKILLLDKDSKQNNDRTWCFWSEEAPKFECARKVHWQNMRFLGKNFEKKASLVPYNYYHIRGLDFYEEIKTQLKKFENIKWQQETVITINESNSEVTTDINKYSADWIFNSVPQFSSAFPLNKTEVKQYFKGYFIKTNKEVFDTDTATLMDFSMNEKDKIEFFYVLPFTKKYALIECTVFTTEFQDPEKYQAKIRKYIKEKIGVVDFEVVEEEKGMIPMTIKPMPLRSSSSVFHVGAAGGMTKATTGYTFQNIQFFCEDLINHWQKDFKTIQLKKLATPKRFSFYDGLLLHIIKKRPHSFQGIMENLFKNNDLPSVIKFLTQKSSLLDEARIFFNLSWYPFLKAVYEKYFWKNKKIFNLKSRRSFKLGNTTYL